MLRYLMHDLRMLFENDMRFLRLWERGGVGEGEISLGFLAAQNISQLKLGELIMWFEKTSTSKD
jgi:hypothetical protein